MTERLDSFKQEVKEAKYVMNEAENRLTKAEHRLTKAVHGARNKGLTWDEIAKEVGLTKQGAWARWSNKVDKNA